MTAPDIVIMAAGKGTRMKSALPKALHRLAGRPMLLHVLDAALALGPRRIIVVAGHGSGQVEQALKTYPSGSVAVDVVQQAQQLGTGHAVMQAMPKVQGDDATVLVLSADVPLIGTSTLQQVVQACGGQRLALLTAHVPDPHGYGRIVREGGMVRGIVEQRDASAAQLAIAEVNTGIMAAPAAHLRRWLAALGNHNSQQEYYLTDIVAMAVADSVEVQAVPVQDLLQIAGVNSAQQLAQLERSLQLRRAGALMEQGVRLADPHRLDVRGTLQCGQDVEIDVGCVFEGHVVLDDGVRVGAHCVVGNARIGAGSVIHPFTHIDGGTQPVVVGAGALIGPYARLRPGARLGDGVHIGNFVEIKNSTLGPQAKANHLAYVGDATVGARVNYGAGSITANYDGVSKHHTAIGDDVHVGSNCVLVAPVEVGPGSTVGAGSVVTRNVPPGALTVTRARPTTLENWRRPAAGKGKTGG